MKGIRPWWTHAAMAALAFAVTLAVKRASDDGTPSDAAPALRAPARNDAARSGTRSALSGRTAEELAAAWNDLAARRLNPGERIALQKAILQRWAEKDLEGALAAVLAEPWDGGQWSIPLENLLREGFGQAFLDRPGDVWRMIQEKRFGPLGSALVRKAWVRVLQEKNPDLFYTYLPEMKGMVLRGALEALGSGLNNRDGAERLWSELLKKDDWFDGQGELPHHLPIQMGYLLTTERVLEEMNCSGSALAELASAAFASKMNFRDQQFDFVAEVAKLPEDVAGRFAFESLKMAWGNKQLLVDAFDHLVQTEQWNYLSQAVAGERVKELARLAPPEEVAAWAAALPPRAETAEMFHRGVEPFIQKDPAAAWEWISGLEDGYWRDRGFAEFSQQSLHRSKDTGKSREALDRIEDPAFKQTAETWRKNWARNNGVSDG